MLSYMQGHSKNLFPCSGCGPPSYDSIDSRMRTINLDSKINNTNIIHINFK